MTVSFAKSLPPTRGRIRFDEPLSRCTWFQVGGAAEALFQPADVQDLSEFLVRTDPGIVIMPLGVGSNVLARDGGLDAVIVRTAAVLGRVAVEGTELVAEAGALDHRVSQAARSAGLSGLEFFIGIPGTIGGAVRMNAGAFGGETADRLVWAEVLDRRGRLQRLPRNELGFSYRHSALPEDCFVVRACFSLVPGDRAKIAIRMNEIKAERALAQPLGVATGGSTFKNPPGHRAWRLIDAAGCRGLEVGKAMVSEKHCNFLVNLGGATASDLETLGETVRERVKHSQGVELEWEIRRIGRPSAMEAAA